MKESAFLLIRKPGDSGNEVAIYKQIDRTNEISYLTTTIAKLISYW